MLIELIKSIRKRKYSKLVTEAIEKANYFRNKTGYKCLVLVIKGKPTVVTKKELKDRIKKNEFKKGTTIQDLEKIALYKTT
jgi:hypothetical protein